MPTQEATQRTIVSNNGATFYARGDGEFITVPIQRKECTYILHHKSLEIWPDGSIQGRFFHSDPLTTEQLEKILEPLGFTYVPAVFSKPNSLPDTTRIGNIRHLLNMTDQPSRQGKYLEAEGRIFTLYLHERYGIQINHDVGYYDAHQVRAEVLRLKEESEEWLLHQMGMTTNMVRLTLRDLLELQFAAERGCRLISHGINERFTVSTRVGQERYRQTQIYGDARQFVRRVKNDGNETTQEIEFLCDNPVIVWNMGAIYGSGVIHYYSG